MRRLSVSGVQPGQLDAYAHLAIPASEETKTKTPYKAQMEGLAGIISDFFNSIGQTRSFGDVGSMSGLRESGHGRVIYEYTPSAARRRHPSKGWHGAPKNLSKRTRPYFDVPPFL